jgi:hypothetical protein
LRPLAPEELPGEPEDPRRLLRLQLTLLLRLSQGEEERGALLRLAGAAGKWPLLRLLDGDDEEALVLAVAAGMPSRAVGLVRLAAERAGVPELLPPLLPTCGGLQAVFAACLARWRELLPPPPQRPTLPVTVLITCHRPQWPLLRLALESIALQSVLSKPLGRGQGSYSMSKRVADVVTFFQAIRPGHSNLKIGIIDALPETG